MRFTALAALALVATLLAGASAQNDAAPACTLMLDVSGSMQGYAKAPGAPLLQLVDRLRGICADGRAFGDSLRPLPPRGAPITFRDLHTRLGPLLKEWSDSAPDGSFLVMMTDNIPDNGGEAADWTEQFYAALRDDNSPFSHIVVMGLRPDFDGVLFDAGPQHRHPVPYRGPRALTLYILGKNANGDAAGFARLRAAVAQALSATGHHDIARGGDDDQAYAVFDVKPFAAETFKVQSHAASIEMDSQSGGTEGSCSGEARFDPTTNTFLLVGQPMDQSCTLKALLSVRFTARWCLLKADLTADKVMQIDDPDVLKQAVQALPVTPPRADLCVKVEPLRVGLKFDAFAFSDKVTFWDKLTRTFTGSFTAHGYLIVRGSVRRDQVFLEKGLGEAWSYGSAADLDSAMSPTRDIQRRVFRLQEGIRAVIPAAQLNGYELIRYPIKIEVRYDQSPVFVLLALVLLVLAVLGAALWLAFRPARIRIVPEDGSETTASLGLFGNATASSGNIELTIVNFAIFLLARANGRVTRGRFMGRGGGRVEVLPSGSAPRGRPSRKRGEDDDDYGGGYDSGGGAPSDPAVFVVSAIGRQSSERYERDDNEF